MAHRLIITFSRTAFFAFHAITHSRFNGSPAYKDGDAGDLLYEVTSHCNSSELLTDSRWHDGRFAVKRKDIGVFLFFTAEQILRVRVPLVSLSALSLFLSIATVMSARIWLANVLPLSSYAVIWIIWSWSQWLYSGWGRSNTTVMNRGAKRGSWLANSSRMRKRSFHKVDLPFVSCKNALHVYKKHDFSPASSQYGRKIASQNVFQPIFLNPFLTRDTLKQSNNSWWLCSLLESESSLRIFT